MCIRDSYIVAAICILPGFLIETAPVSTGAVYSGLIMGLVYFLGFFFIIYVVKWNGVSATTAVGVLAMLLPIAVAAAWWDKFPTAVQYAGITLAILALLLIGWKSEVSDNTDRPWFAPLAMLAFFLLCGCSRVAQEALNYVAIPADFDIVSGELAISEADYLKSQRPTFVLSAFVAATVPSVILLVYMWLIRKHRFLWTEFAVGSVMGATNVVQLYLVLKCLDQFPGYIVFPVTAAGSILLTTLIAVACFGERPSRKTYVGIAITVVALFLLR